MRIKHKQRGSVIVSILIVTLLLSVVISALVVLANSNLTRARGRVLLLQAQYAAESGADAAIAVLNSGNTTYGGSAGEVQVLSNSLYRATYSTTVTNGISDKEKIITSIGRVYAPKTASQPTQSRSIEITSQRGTTTSGMSLVSRNIIEVASSVKNIKAIDVWANSYINMQKSNNNLIAETITAVGKNTGANNCSIGGSGSLTKPTSFSHAGQTKTQIKTTYNNCIIPPGNTSNANFDVMANNASISPIVSTYIPWNQYMDSTYTDAGNCNDWLLPVGGPHNIPSVAGSKKTHYPDSGSNVSLTCSLGGNQGDIALGSEQYNISDNVHIRANFCAVLSSCSPIFNNTTASLKFVFIEGSINLNKVTTAAGSGPIVLVVYGTDPSSKTNTCPLGGAAYIGNDSATSAPQLYILAVNGVCLDKTKFSADPNLGGLSGKNVYIATNPSTLNDLSLNVNFPYGQVPINLSWRAIRYRRL